MGIHYTKCKSKNIIQINWSIYNIETNPDGIDAISKAKSYASEKVLRELQNHFNNNTSVFKDCIGKQLEAIRISI